MYIYHYNKQKTNNKDMKIILKYNYIKFNNFI